LITTKKGENKMEYIGIVLLVLLYGCPCAVLVLACIWVYQEDKREMKAVSTDYVEIWRYTDYLEYTRSGNLLTYQEYKEGKR
jgi:hypothetical protein